VKDDESGDDNRDELTGENFRKLLFKSDKKKLSFRRVESKNVCSHPGRDLL